ncbi:MAG: PHP domain-containing protein [Anaerolineae bacterium]
MRVDLHIHTTASDGRWTAEQVVAGVQAEGIELFAVADHDSVGNVLRTERLAQEAGLAFLRAVEISTLDDGALFHILGYGVDPTDGALRALLSEHTEKMAAVDAEDIRRLIELGYPLDYEEYLSYDYDRTRGGFKSLNYCIDRGLCTGPRDFFVRLRAELGHRWPEFVHPREAISIIRGAGGHPILAHPGESLAKRGGLSEAALVPFLEYGIEGLECYSQYHEAAMTAFCVEWCKRRDLLITGGSDYHGGFVSRRLGVPRIDLSDLRLGPLWEGG